MERDVGDPSSKPGPPHRTAGLPSLNNGSRPSPGEDEIPPSESSSESKAYEVLYRANSSHEPGMSRQDKWRKKLQNKLPLLMRRKTEPSPQSVAAEGLKPADKRSEEQQCQPSNHRLQTAAAGASDFTRRLSIPSAAQFRQRLARNVEALATARPPAAGRGKGAGQGLAIAGLPWRLRSLTSPGRSDEPPAPSVSLPGASPGEEPRVGSVTDPGNCRETQGSRLRGPSLANSKVASASAAWVARVSAKRSSRPPPPPLNRSPSGLGGGRGEQDHDGSIHFARYERRKGSECEASQDTFARPQTQAPARAPSTGQEPSLDIPSQPHDSPKSPLMLLVNAIRKTFFFDSSSSAPHPPQAPPPERKSKARNVWHQSNPFPLSLSPRDRDRDNAGQSQPAKPSVRGDDVRPKVITQQPLPCRSPTPSLPHVPIYRSSAGPFGLSPQLSRSAKESPEGGRRTRIIKTESLRETRDLGDVPTGEGHLQPVARQPLAHPGRKTNPRFWSLRSDQLVPSEEEPGSGPGQGSRNEVWKVLESFRRKSFWEKEMKESLSGQPASLQLARKINIQPTGPAELPTPPAFTEEELESESSDEVDQGRRSLIQRNHSLRQRRKMHKLAQQQMKREALKRLHRAQVIQRQLQEVEERQGELEQRGVLVEKALREETELNATEESELMQKWFKLVLEKNALIRYEAELMIFAQELELEDQQSSLQEQLRFRMAVDDTRKTEQEIAAESQTFYQMLDIVERRDRLVSLLERQRLEDKAKDKDFESFVLAKGYKFNWAPAANSDPTDRLG